MHLAHALFINIDLKIKIKIALPGKLDETYLWGMSKNEKLCPYCQTSSTKGPHLDPMWILTSHCKSAST